MLKESDYKNAPPDLRSVDLRRMRGGTLAEEWRYFGSESPTGKGWYNFDPLTYLECALAGMSACACNENADLLTPGWRPFASFLELGRTYE